MAIWGANINNRHVDWIRRYLPNSVIIFQNTTLPHVPVEDNSFALVYGFSVITHIDHFETAWLLEIRRMLKKKGYAYLSFHSEHTWEIMGPYLPIYNALAENNEYIKEYDISLALFKNPMPKAKTVFTCSKDDINNCNVFYTVDYIRKEWGKIFKVVDIMHEYHDYQDVVLLQKV
jgi:SAM-dependent methyltransferase